VKGFFGEVRGEESVELWLVDFWEGYREQGEQVWGEPLDRGMRDFVLIISYGDCYR
jgi:hypothetical protein